MGVMSQLIRLTTKTRYFDFLNSCYHPERAREKTWESIWKEIGLSPFWLTNKGNSGSSLPPLESFEITTYEDYREAIEKTYESGLSQLTKSDVIFFAESSGTISKPKLFPLTEPYLKELQVTQKVYLHSLCKRYPRFLTGPGLYFAWSMSDKTSPTGIETGFISGFNYKRVPWALRKFYAFPYEVFKSTEIFQKWGGLYALSADLTAMFAVTPMVVSSFMETVFTNLEHYWPIWEGRATLPDNLPMPQISKRRLAFLKRTFSQDRPSLSGIWPNLQFIACWTTSTAALQIPLLSSYTHGKTPIVDGIYSATEGWINVPLDKDKGGILHPKAHVVEFAEVGGLDQGEPTAKDLMASWDLEDGKEYEVFVTNSMGLVRYRLGDIVRCTGHLGLSPRLEFVGKIGNTLCLGSTKIEEGPILRALRVSRISFEGPWAIGPGIHGENLTVYCQSISEENNRAAEKFDEALGMEMEDYRYLRSCGQIKSVTTQELAADHPFWRRQVHAQTKPKYVITTPPSLN